MQPPLIGITTTQKIDQKVKEQVTIISEAYVTAIIQAGGIPLLIPLEIPDRDIDALVQRLDGILFTGGGDMDPRHFDHPMHPKVYDVIPDRDRIEIDLVRKAVAGKLPFLAICRGIQVLNVALGGTLYVDITEQRPASIQHNFFDDFPLDHLAHPVFIEPQNRLWAILQQKEMQVNSMHHQGINKLAPSLRATAHASDGLVESVELEDHPFGIGVQWHPEWLLHLASMRGFFTALIEASKNRM